MRARVLVLIARALSNGEIAAERRLRTQGVLRLERLVNRELLDVGSSLHLDAGRRDCLLDPALEVVESLARLPEIDHGPTVFDRARGVKELVLSLAFVPLRPSQPFHLPR